MHSTTIYNMYSSGENVLGNIPYDKGNHTASPSYIWESQEKLKGRMFEWTDWLIGSAVCGWGGNEVDFLAPFHSGLSLIPPDGRFWQQAEPAPKYLVESPQFA